MSRVKRRHQIHPWYPSPPINTHVILPHIYYLLIPSLVLWVETRLFANKAVFMRAVWPLGRWMKSEGVLAFCPPCFICLHKQFHLHAPYIWPCVVYCVCAVACQCTCRMHCFGVWFICSRIDFGERTSIRVEREGSVCKAGWLHTQDVGLPSRYTPSPDTSAPSRLHTEPITSLM